MCGIAGIIGAQEPYFIEIMNGVQKHRGPDDEGIFRDETIPLSFGHRRLSIVDLKGGKQPLANEDETVWIVFNGEIFNAPELRKYLLTKGHSFKSHNSDTEVLVHLYEEYKEEMLRYLNGMFAFVIYDKKAGKVFGARDRFGIKPLYYTLKSNIFAFSSELKSMMPLNFMSKTIDIQSLYHYLSLQFVPSPRTIFKDIKKVPAGYCFIYKISNNKMYLKRYWEANVNEDKNIVMMSIEEIKRKIRELVVNAVSKWLMSDVPVGCSLSGGLDSTVIVGLMKNLGYENIQTWTLGFEDDFAQIMDERKNARIVAKRYGTSHNEIVISADNLIDEIQDMIWHLDEPYAGGLPSWFIYKRMHAHVKVAITGTGGDELFGNYGKWINYYWHTIGGINKNIKLIKRNGMYNFFKYYWGSLYHGYLGEKQKASVLIENRIINDKTTVGMINQMWMESRATSYKNAVPYIDLQMQLPDEFLHMTDRFSMAWSIEARTPLLDHKLVEFVLKIPPNIRTNRKDLKGLMKSSFLDLIPEEILISKKRGFVLPISKWIKGRLGDQISYFLGNGYLSQQGIFNPKIIELTVNKHMSGKKNMAIEIWTIFMFQLWWEKYINQK